jgi:basic membrane lipoprotein Med (substrate-binding protein (PBP1-ABC) superfamily)
MKKIDVAVFDSIKSVQDGAFEAGTDRVFDLKSDGVSLGKVNSEGEKYSAEVDKVKEQLAAGEIDVPNTVE